MKRPKLLKILMVGSVFLSVSLWLTSCVGTKGFRNAKWGMTQDEVQRIEKNRLVDSSSKEEVLRQIFKTQDSDSFLLYEGDVGGVSCTIVYSFCENGQLKEGGYLLTENYYENPQGWNTAQKNYKRIKHLLREKYGTAILGELSSKTVWQNRSTYIIMHMDKESQDDQILLSVLYVPKNNVHKYIDIESDKIKKKKLLERL